MQEHPHTCEKCATLILQRGEKLDGRATYFCTSDDGCAELRNGELYLRPILDCPTHRREAS